MENTNTQGQFEIKKQEMLEPMKCIKVTRTTGPDAIDPWLLRKASEKIVVAVKKIFASYLARGKVTRDWSETNVVPLLKGSRENVGNYRSVIGKLLGRILQYRIFSHLEEN